MLVSAQLCVGKHCLVHAGVVHGVAFTHCKYRWFWWRPQFLLALYDMWRPGWMLRLWDSTVFWLQTDRANQHIAMAYDAATLAVTHAFATQPSTAGC